MQAKYVITKSSEYNFFGEIQRKYKRKQNRERYT